MNFKEDNEYGVQIVYSTLPNRNGQKFAQGIEDQYFNKYKSDIKCNKDNQHLYSPLKYYMLGDYDICYITLINNFKFSHRLFEPTGNIVEHFNSHTFQSYSGFGLNDSNDLKDCFINKPEKYFVGIIHLKLNNGLYLGNGQDYIEVIKDYINAQIPSEIRHLLIQTFSWFELSLVVFINKPQDFTGILTTLRSAKFENIADKDSKLYKNCLYCLEDDFTRHILKANLFSDTNSNIGIHSNLINEKLDSQKCIDFLANNEIKLKTEIEWQVKPGHISGLIKEIKKHKYLKYCFDIETKNLVLGKCDYFIAEKKSENLEANFHLIRDIARDEKCTFFRHIRKVRTYVFLEPNDNEGNIEDSLLSSDKILQNLAIKTQSFTRINNKLKELKVSRQLRIKILKILSNYNNGITDPVLFTYFLDFSIFIENLIGVIEENHRESLKKSTGIKILEKKLSKYIDVFQEGYNVRFLNGYQFENISDFDLDFNNSIQQLLTSYGSIVYEYGKVFYSTKEDDKKENINHFPILQLNNLDTESDYLSINYSVYHLTSPEFVFTTLTKEILNHIRNDNKKLNDFVKEIVGYETEMRKFINESYFDDLIENKMINIDYFIIDSLRYLTTFQGDFKLFEYWFWAYNFQNSSLYDSSGEFNEAHLRNELFRIMLIQKHFKRTDIPLKMPSSEIYSHWNNHFKKIDAITNKVFEFLKKKNDTYNKLNDFLEYHSNNYINSMNSNNEELKIINEKIVRFLKTHKKRNNDNIILLKRDWKSGNIFKNYLPLYKNELFAIDQTGGVFSYDVNNMQKYFNLNAKIIKDILGFSAKRKKEFIKDLKLLIDERNKRHQTENSLVE